MLTRPWLEPFDDDLPCLTVAQQDKKDNSYNLNAWFLMWKWFCTGPNGLSKACALVCMSSWRLGRQQGSDQGARSPFTRPPRKASMNTTDTAVNGLAQARSRLWEMIKDIRFAMFTTRHHNGHLHARPMTTQNSDLDEDSCLWFFMSRSGDPVADIASEPIVNLVYADPGEDTYVSISGTASVVEDLAKKEQLWSKAAQAWFPGGVTDADLALVRVQITHANYWDIDESKIVQLFRKAQAVITGKPVKGLGEHAEIRMNA